MPAISIIYESDRGWSGKIFSAQKETQPMENQTETLQVGARAPEFALAAANREGKFVLSELVRSGPVIVEFVRGTW
jgi:hypothetical protein